MGSDRAWYAQNNPSSVIDEASPYTLITKAIKGMFPEISLAEAEKLYGEIHQLIQAKRLALQEQREE